MKERYTTIGPYFIRIHITVSYNGIQIVSTYYHCNHYHYHFLKSCLQLIVKSTIKTCILVKGRIKYVQGNLQFCFFLNAAQIVFGVYYSEPLIIALLNKKNESLVQLYIPESLPKLFIPINLVHDLNKVCIMSLLATHNLTHTQ